MSTAGTSIPGIEKYPIAPMKTSPRSAADFYDANGFVIGPPVIPRELLNRTSARMDAVMAGEYDTGMRPLDGWWKPTDDPARKLRKLDQPHIADRTIYECITHPALGKWIAEMTGAKLIQVWAVQHLFKPGTGLEEVTKEVNVGWHQDYFYWKTWWTPESEIFTCWLAISDVTEQSGPMRFVPGSHRWGLLEAGDFFGEADESQRKSLPLPPGAQWTEQAAVMPPGAFSLHQRLTYHGSGPNRTLIPRRSFAIHVRTENSTPTPSGRPNPADPDNYDYVALLDDPKVCPIIYKV